MHWRYCCFPQGQINSYDTGELLQYMAVFPLTHNRCEVLNKLVEPIVAQN